MFARTRIAMAAVPALLMLGACTSTTAAAPAAPATSVAAATSAPASAASSAAAAVKTADATTLALKMADSSLGSILVDGNGKTLYLFTKDSPNTSACAGQCLVAWPPLIGKPTVGSGVDDSKLGSFTRADGSVQATYNGWPLYYWKGDAKAGDVAGQNVQSVWFVIDHDGNAVKK